MATYDDIKHANATIRTTDVRGKEYAEVNQRVRAFRMIYPDGTIKTRLLSNEGEIGKRTCIFYAEVGYFDRYGDDVERYRVLATGTAYENEGSTQINRTSYIENCETSAVGRALGFLGIGIDVSIASADEVQRAIAQQEERKAPQKAPQTAQDERRDTRKGRDAYITSEQVNTLLAALTANGLTLASVLAHYNVANERELTVEMYMDALERINRFSQKREAKK